MKNITITLTDSQYSELMNYVAQNKVTGGTHKSFVAIYSELTETFLRNIKKEITPPAKQTASEMLAKDSDPFKSLVINFNTRGTNP